MKFAGEFTVPARREIVYDRLNDAQFFASCVEGVRDLVALDDGRYTAILETRIAYIRSLSASSRISRYAGHRLSPWLGHLMVSRQETARPLLTAGEVMQLPPTDELVLVSGISPIRAKKARYYEDRRLAARIMPPPSLGAGGLGDRPVPRPCDWNHPLVPSQVLPVAGGSAATFSTGKTEAQANAGIRREPELANHESVVPKTPESVFAVIEDEPDDEPDRANTLRQRMSGVARQAAMDPE